MELRKITITVIIDSVQESSMDTNISKSLIGTGILIFTVLKYSFITYESPKGKE